MLSKKERLNREEFSHFFAIGRRFHTSCVQCIYTPHDTVHVAVVISKKSAKHAVVRNKLRRQIYAIVRLYGSKQAFSGVFIFLVKKDMIGKTYTEIQKEIQSMIDTILKKT